MSKNVILVVVIVAAVAGLMWYMKKNYVPKT